MGGRSTGGSRIYYGPTFEQHLSLLHWKGLGKNETGNHITGAQSLVVRSDREIKIRVIPQRTSPIANIPGLKNALMVDEHGGISKGLSGLAQFLDKSERENENISGPEGSVVRYEISQNRILTVSRFFPVGFSTINRCWCVAYRNSFRTLRNRSACLKHLSHPLRGVSLTLEIIVWGQKLSS